MGKAILVLLMFASACAFGQSADFDKSARDYLSKLPIPLFYAACNTKSGRAVMVIPLSGSAGMVFELRRDRVVNSARVFFKDGEISVDIAQTQGGIYTYAIMTGRVKDLSKFPFALSLSKETEAILDARSDRVCVDREPSQ